MTTPTIHTNHIKALGADFGNYTPWNARFAELGNRTFNRCYQLGDDVWEESTDENPICDWTFTRENGQFHAQVKTTLAEALRIATDWNADCPTRGIALVSSGTVSRKIEITHQLSLV